MRVLLAHSAYDRSQPSGENAFVEFLGRELSARGFEVSNLQLEVNDWSIRRRVATMVGVVSGRIGMRRLVAEIDRFKPDIVHFNNVFPQISPLILKELDRRGIPTVMTLHNYRLGCLNGLCYRDGDICERCVGGRLSIPGVARGCYRGSVAGSAAIALHRRRLLRHADRVTRFLAVSELVAEKAVAAGVQDVAVSVTRNFPVDRGAATISPTTGEAALRMLFAARLTEEKGTKLLLDALALVPNENVRLVVVGSGPLEAEVKCRCQSDPRVDFRGLVASDVVDQLIEESDLVLVPSQWFEADPLMIHQALSRGVPPLVLDKSSAARTLGTTPELVSGRTPAALAQSIVRLSEDRALLSDVAERATREYRASFAPVIDQIVGHYEELFRPQ